MSCTTPQNPLQRDGTSQASRLLAALKPEYIQVDERKTEDILAWAVEYAKQLRYYDFDNEEDGTWRELIEHDISVTLSIILQTDSSAESTQFRELREDVLNTLNSLTSTDAEIVDAFRALMDFVYQQFLRFDSWFRRSIEEFNMRKEYEQIIEGLLAKTLQSFIGYEKGIHSLHTIYKLHRFSLFSEEWGVSDTSSISADTSVFLGLTLRERITSFMDPYGEYSSDAGIRPLESPIEKVFEYIFEQNVRIMDKSQSYLEKTLESYPSHQPHMGLFIAFVLLFKYQQDKINELTAEHLDYYYKEVLQLSLLDAEPDKIHVIFELAKNATEQLVPAGTLLKAGKDDSGKEIFFSVDPEIVVNRAKVASLKTFFINKRTEGTADTVAGLYASPVANSADGEGAAIETEPATWAPFGEDQSTLTDDTRTMPDAEVGWAFTSPMFLMKEGNRRVTVKINLDSSDTNYLKNKILPLLDADETSLYVAETIVAESLRVRFSGEEAWVNANDYEDTASRGEVRVYLGRSVTVGFPLTGASTATPPIVNVNSGTIDNYITVEVDLPQSAPAIIGYDSEVLGKTYATTHPVMEVLVIPNGDHDVYNALKELKFSDVVFTVQVEGITNLIVQNDDGEVDPSKPFFPFGTQPKIGSSLYLGNNEVFSKPVQDVFVKINWMEQPSDFHSHYVEYKTSASSTVALPFQQMLGVDATRPKGTNNFRVRGYFLNEFKWSNTVLATLPNDPRLFEENASTVLPARQLSYRFSTIPKLDGVLSQDELTAFRPGIRRGFMKLELTNDGGGKDFLHSKYSKLLMNSVLRASALDLKVDGWKRDDETNDEVKTPNEPYTPKIKDISLGYLATATMNFEGSNMVTLLKNTDESILHVHPFGWVQILPPVDASVTLPEGLEYPENVHYQNFLVPQFRTVSQDSQTDCSTQVSTISFDPDSTLEGALYLGIENLDVPRSLSLLFQVSEGSGDTDYEIPTVEFAYLSQNNWVKFTSNQIVADELPRLVQSEIIQFTVPSTANTDNTLLPAGYIWLRAAVMNNSPAIPRFLTVQAQAALATFSDNGNDLSRLNTALAAESVKGLKNSINQIKKASQPYSSFDGRAQEESESFYTRVSERLRHKNRSIMIWDYEHIVLQNFPAIYKVRCLNHTNELSELAPGSVTLVLIPNLRNVNSANLLEPRVSVGTIADVKSFIIKKMPPWVHLDVRNPKYEKIRVSVDVTFRSGYDPGYYMQVLSDDIVQYLSPWAYDEGGEIVFGGTVYKSVLVNFVEERAYVDYISRFEMFHIVDGLASNDVNEITPSTSMSILVSADSHEITLNDNCAGGCNE